MKTTMNRILLSALFAFWAGCDGSISKGDGVTVFLEPLAEGDLALAPGGVGLVSGLDLSEAVNFEKAPTKLSWRLDGSPIREVPAPHVAQSKSYWEYWQESKFYLKSATISITSPGAVVKLSPKVSLTRSATPKAIAIDDLVFTDANGFAYAAADAIENGATSDEFQRGEMPFSEGTTVLKMRSDLAAGPLRLGLRPGAATPGYDVLVQVYEPNSTAVLELQSKADAYSQGQSLEVIARWQGNVTPKSNTIHGQVFSPSGAKFPVELTADQSGAFVGSLPLTESASKPGELWEIQIDAEANSEAGSTKRTARTAFAYSAGTASFEPAVTLAEWPIKDDLKVRFGVQVASAGRYAVTGVLYGTSATGERVPFMVSQAALTAVPGINNIELVFEDADFAAAGLSAPYEIRDLRLLDQTRMGLLHRQSFAIVLPSVNR
jgi:hypothetical protein